MAVALAYAVGEALFWGVVEPTVVFLSTSEGAYVAATTTAGIIEGVRSAGKGLSRGRNLDDGITTDDRPPDDIDPTPGGVIPDGSHPPNHIVDGPPTHTWVDEIRKDAHREYRFYKHALLRYRHHIMGPAFFAGLVKFCKRFWRYLSQRERADLLRIGHRRLSVDQYRTVRNIAVSLVEAGSQSTPVRRAREMLDPTSSAKRRRH